MTTPFVRPSYSISLGTIIPPEISPEDSQCAYIILRGNMKGMRCPKQAIPGTNLCTMCSQKNVAQKLKKTMPLPKLFNYRLKFNSVMDLSSMRENKIMTDVTLVAEGTSFVAHKLFLVAASPFFEKLFNLEMKEAGQTIFELPEVSKEVLGNYLDLIYGKTLTISRWTVAFDLYSFFERTLMKWNPDQVVCEVYVPPEEYVEFIGRLDSLYGGNIPVEVIKASKKFVNKTVDLSSFGKEFVDLVRPPPHPDLSGWIPLGPEIHPVWEMPGDVSNGLDALRMMSNMGYYGSPN